MIKTSELTAWLGADATAAVMLANMEAQAVAHLERMTGRYFGPVQEVTEQVRGNNRDHRRLYLRDIPVAETVGGAVTVTVQFAAVGEDLEDDTAFVVRVSGTEAWLERTDGAIWNQAYEYSVTYFRGYLPGAEPEDIRGVVLYMVSKAWQRRGKEGLQSETIGGYSYTVESKDERGYVESIVRMWRRPMAA